jgi:DNA repair exonuclease SbcCD ATPase subunit
VSAPNERMSDEALEVARFCECLTHRTALSEEAKRARAAELALQAEVEMVTQQRDAEVETCIRLCDKLNLRDVEIARLRQAIEIEKARGEEYLKTIDALRERVEELEARMKTMKPRTEPYERSEPQALMTDQHKPISEEEMETWEESIRTGHPDEFGEGPKPVARLIAEVRRLRAKIAAIHQIGHGGDPCNCAELDDGSEM